MQPEPADQAELNGSARWTAPEEERLEAEAAAKAEETERLAAVEAKQERLQAEAHQRQWEAGVRGVRRRTQGDVSPRH